MSSPYPSEGADLLLTRDANVELVAPFQEDDTATQVIRCHNFIYVPSKYVPMFLDRPLTPKEGRERLVGTIRGPRRS
jgi:hypothetical protein